MKPREEIENNLIDTLDIIFSGCDIGSFSDYEKRKMVFEYLTSTLTYDFEMLDKIRDYELGKGRVSRNPIVEFMNVVNNKNGICNGISQYYKMLLEQLGIKAYCVVCDDGTEVNHQLNLVYDDNNDCYSFDDVTSVIVGRGTTSEYFDYDLQFANSVNQGNRAVFNNLNYVILPEAWINYVVGRNNSLADSLDFLPDNIVSIKNKGNSK